jgi:hypothetical protein
MAQTTPAPSTQPSTTTTTTAPAAKPTPPTTNAAGDMTMTDQQAQGWIDRTIYSSDDKNVGEVAELRRDSDGKLTELHADVGGFLGLGETRVRLMPGQFKFGDDRVVLNVTADQVKTLPKLEK